MHPCFHAASSVRKLGGRAADYIEIHAWFDASKAHLPDLRHRALRHHAEGIFLCERIFGLSIINSDGREVPVRQIAEQHIVEDLGRIPTAADWLREVRLQPWMLRRSREEAPDGVPVDPSKPNRRLINLAHSDDRSENPEPATARPGESAGSLKEVLRVYSDREAVEIKLGDYDHVPRSAHIKHRVGTGLG